MSNTTTYTQTDSNGFSCRIMPGAADREYEIRQVFLQHADEIQKWDEELKKDPDDYPEILEDEYVEEIAEESMRIAELFKHLNVHLERSDEDYRGTHKENILFFNGKHPLDTE